jgi:hypothetical protein
VNARGPGGFGIGDAPFTDDSAPGVSWSAESDVLDWSAPQYGDAPDDESLEIVMQSIRSSTEWPSMSYTLEALTVGQRYKLQLLFYEQCCDRGFDVWLDNVRIIDEFSPYLVHGGIAPSGGGAVVTHTFTAGNTYVSIVLDGNDTTFPDRSPILHGLTLEHVGGGP